MKILKLILTVILLLVGLPIKAQDNTSSPVLYTVVYNHVPEGFKYPLIGFINHGEGNQHGAQIGFVNINEKEFMGSQISFVNTSGGAVNGLQIGFINTVADYINGAQIGFVNTSTKYFKGTQIGFINTAVMSSNGAQIGFVNTVANDLKGTQIGFVNINPKEVTGAQIGFVNVVKKLNSVQVGFLNYADSVGEGAVPIGFLSIIRKGGYKALEVGFTEMHPVNMALKIGVSKFYTTLNGAYNPDFKNKFALGGGFGSLLPLGSKVYLNPEGYYLNHINSNKDMARLSLNLGLALSPKVHIMIGPSAVWSGTDRANDFLEPMFYFYKERIDYRNEFLIGMNASLRYNFTF
ncbi:LA_2272 family surface repeat-containing protein [Echinicola shivajiensis]|uniref:LA_2272 family surface repeat-containing protein n=1 Tax=Echinicola shivajiensis TaxID=1035916 RepID=UPI001BFC1D10|nr:hypothetical protein [Echinicola shivajiensis]